MPIIPTTNKLAANCPLIQIYNTTLLISDATTVGNAPTCDSIAFQDSPWTQKQRRNALRQDFAHIYGGGGGCIAIVTGCVITADATPLMIDVSAGKILCPGYQDVTPNGGAPKAVHDNTALVYIWMDYLGNVSAVDNNPTAPAPNLLFLGTVTTAAGAVTAIDFSGVCYMQGGRVFRGSGDDGAPTDTPPVSVALVHKTAFATYHSTNSIYSQVAIPQRSSDPGSPQNSDVWWRSDLSQLRVRSGGTTIPVGSIANQALVVTGASGAALTVNFANGVNQKITLTANCIFTFTPPVGPGNVTLSLIQDGTGSRVVTWPASVKWAGAAPTLSTTAGARNVIQLWYDGTDYIAVAGSGLLAGMTEAPA